MLSARLYGNPKICITLGALDTRRPGIRHYDDCRCPGNRYANSTILLYESYCVTDVTQTMFEGVRQSVAWWRHQMETISALLAICAGNSSVTGEFPAQRPVSRSFDVSLISAWINGWVNNREAGDLRRHRAHYDVIVMGFLVIGGFAFS